MRYLLLMNYAEPAPGDIPEEAITETQEAFGAYGRALEEAGRARRRRGAHLPGRRPPP